MPAHVDPVALKLDSFRLQAKALFQSRFAGQSYAASRSQHSVPGHTGPRARPERPYHLARSAGISCQPRYSAIRTHPAFGNLAHNR